MNDELKKAAETMMSFCTDYLTGGIDDNTFKICVKTYNRGINGAPNFEAYWGNKGEKWNGKLDIKKFSTEVWEAAIK